MSTLFRHFMEWTTKFLAEECNRRLKICNGEAVELLICNYPIWHEGGILRNPRKTKAKSKEDNTSDDRNFSKSVSRAKTQLYDYVLCNPDMNVFVTLTLDKEQVNRYDYKEIIKKLNNWLDNKVRRNGLKYVLVPELHKDGAIHFHGFFNDTAVKMVDSGHKYLDGRIIYNLPQWSLGFTTGIITTGSRSRIANYICKYISKQLTSGKIGGRYYLHGGNLAVPEYEYDYCHFDEKQGYCFSIPETNMRFVKITK